MSKDLEALKLRESDRRQRRLQAQHVDEHLNLEERHRQDFLGSQSHWQEQAQHLEYSYSHQRTALKIKHNNELSLLAQVCIWHRRPVL